MFKKAINGLLLAATLILSAPALAAGPELTMYKNQGCTCCDQWVKHMQKNGFKVKTVTMADVTPIKDKAGIPASLRSCHTTVGGGYSFEGHVPAALIAKVLKEKPAISGLAVGGMPPSAPGMDVPGVKQPYQVMAFSKKGSSVYAKR